MTVDETGVDETVVDETGVGINCSSLPLLTCMCHAKADYATTNIKCLC